MKAYESLSPQEVVQLQHTIEQYAAAIAANSGLRLRGTVQDSKSTTRRCLARRRAAAAEARGDGAAETDS